MWIVDILSGTRNMESVIFEIMQGDELLNCITDHL
jgi:hypothetical protein